MIDMPRALQHEHPMRGGRQRIVSARRARVLRKRGVLLIPLHAVYLNPCDAERGQSRAPLTPGNGPGKQSARYVWFECKDDADNRKRDKARACYQTWLDAELRGSRARLYRGVIHENVLQDVNPQLDLYAKAFAAMQVETATGYTLDALAGVPMPARWTDEQKRHYLQRGYVMEFGTLTADMLMQRESPPVTLWYAPHESSGPLEFGSEPR